MNQVSKLRPDLTFGLILFAVLLLIRVISGFNGLYGQDSYEYLRYSRRISEFITAGKPPGDYFWPVNFPLLGAMLSLITRDNMMALQLISMLSFVFTAIYTFRLIRLIYPDTEKELFFFLSLFLIPSPFLFQSAFVVMSDMLAVFLSTAAIFHVLRYRSQYKRTDFFLAILFALSAVLTRYAAGAVLFVPGILLAISFYKRFRLPDLLLGLLILMLCLGPQVLIKGSDSVEFLGQKWLGFWSIKNWFFSEFNTIDGHHDYRFPNLIYSFSNFYYPGFFFPGVILAFFIQKKYFQNVTNSGMILTIVLYALFVSGFPTQNMRFLLLTFPLAIAIMFPLFQRFKHKIINKKGLLVYFSALVILLQFALIYKYSSGIYRASQIEKEIARTVLTYPERPIYTFAVDGALRCYGMNSDDIVNLWYSELDSVKTSSLLLFNQEKFKNQWRGKNPMINWQFIRDNYNLEKLETLSDGWQLYRVRSKRL